MNVTRINLILAVKVAVILTLLLPCLNVESDTKVETSLELKFVQIIDKINQTLSNKEQTFKSSKYELASFVDEILMPLWSSNKTIKGLFGGKIWNNLSIADQRALAISFNNTLQRYIQEGFDYYDGQKIEFVKLVLNRKQTKGFLTVKIIPKVLPDFTIDLKVSRIEGGWYFYDVYVKGVSYISLKKDGYRSHFRNHGLLSILTEIEQKNHGFIASSFSR